MPVVNLAIFIRDAMHMYVLCVTYSEYRIGRAIHDATLRKLDIKVYMNTPM